MADIPTEDRIRYTNERDRLCSLIGANLDVTSIKVHQPTGARYHRQRLRFSYHAILTGPSTKCW